MKLQELSIKIFADGADPVIASEQAKLPYISGFTTNPSLMRKAGIVDYAAWADIFLECVNGKPVSFEVLSDDFGEMERQARKIAKWGANVYVKIPIMNTSGKTTTDLIHRLSGDGVKVNVTAVFTLPQVEVVSAALENGAASIISVFAGRIADTGRDPESLMREAVSMTPVGVELLWASGREIFNVVQAEDANCDIITLTPDLIAKLPLLGKNLGKFSWETVKQFYDDAMAAGYTL